MRFAVFSWVIFALLLTPVFAQNELGNEFDEFNIGQQETNEVAGQRIQGSLGNEFGRELGSSAVEGAASGLEGSLAGVMQTLNMILQVFLLGLAAMALAFFIWLIILLITIRHIMKRDDLTGGEKAAWVIVVFFCGFLPLSPLGILFYALVGRKAKTTSK